MKQKSTVGIFDVMRAQWHGGRGHRLLFVAAVFFFALEATAGIFSPLLFKVLFDGFSSGASQAVLLPTLYHLTGIALLSWAASRLGHITISAFEARSMAQLAQDGLDALIRRPHSFYANNFAGSLVQKVRRFAQSFEKIFDTIIITFIPISITIIGAIYVVYNQKPALAYIMLVWVCTFIILNYIFSLFKVKYDVRRAVLDTEMTGTLADIISNHSAIALFVTEDKERGTFKNVADRRAKAVLTSWTLSTVFDGVQALVMVGLTFVVFYYTIQYWSLGLVSLGTFALVQIYLIQLSAKMWDLGRVIRHLYEAFADSREMVEVMCTPNELVNVPDATALKVPHGEIVLDAVTFNYNETRMVLDNVSLVIPAGQKVALVGPSGAGKSTFITLLLRLYDVTAGSILIDGQNIQHVTLESLRTSISLVPQDPALFHRSLMENIRYGRLTATDDEVEEAARLAHCDEFIDKLSNKYATLVGERGIKLSGGERQRVAIARAILKNAPILILDEATSSLDSHSEALIQDALDVLMKNKTVIVIAHRLSTIRKMDRIIVIDEGKVREDGTHDVLLKTEGSLYRQLWELQAGGFMVEKDE